MDQIAQQLADTLRALRQERKLTQQMLAKRAGIPRATLTTLESGTSNPTLLVLSRLSQALGVSIEALLTPPRMDVQVWHKEKLPVRVIKDVTVTRVVPEAIAGLLIERMTFVQPSSLAGSPHGQGTREFLHVETGCMRVTVAGCTQEVPAGSTLSFNGHQKHSYSAVSKDTTAMSVVVYGKLGEL